MSEEKKITQTMNNMSSINISNMINILETYREKYRNLNMVFWDQNTPCKYKDVEKGALHVSNNTLYWVDFM